ncbi:MAG: DUF541 domain-containing protein [Gammaproteobacteria bacterium]|nr:DUF541 domain-containing protein [Gammaproteobacteria bacterium]
MARPSNRIILIASLIFTSPLSAHEAETLFNQVNMQAQVERDVPNDEMQVMLVSERQGKNATSLSRDVNAEVKWALNLAKRNKDIKVSTRAYQTYPVYKNQDVVGWRVSQEVQLKSHNMAGLSELVGELQEKLQVRQMLFSASKASRDVIESELIEEAMQAFKRRALILKKHMDNKDYRIVNLHINTSGQSPQYLRAQRSSMKTMEMASAPAVEAGTSKINVTVSGSIQFF